MAEEIEKKSEDEKPTLTVFGPETEFDGVLEFRDDLIITGKFNGRIKAAGNLEIAKDSICNVEKISAKSIVISGSCPVMEGGARVQGPRCLRGQGDTGIVVSPQLERPASFLLRRMLSSF